ncbi:GNAT family N-acetyltransferase [Anaerobacillus sp. MEB173]|uniref:GNAT family N-acetyltransferase n=1 Tax=Anaerobacillus sp. MEB173 TaxID=3383345 RepID=UPI003F92B697
MDILYKGTLVCQTNHKYENFQVSKLNHSHITQVMQVQSNVLEHVQVKESLQPLTGEEFDYIFNGGGLIIGVFVERHLIAFRALLFPGNHIENLGRDLGLTKEEQMKVVHQEISCVLPEYRGNGLQKQLASLIMKEFNQLQHDYRYLCCTVFPTNFPSLIDKFTQEMLIAKITEKYSGRMRYVLFKDLERKRKLDENTIIAIPINDYERQKKLLKLGFYGFGLKEENGETVVLFGEFF